MRAVVHSDFGGPEVLQLVERPIPEPAWGEVRIRIVYSGVNPADSKRRSRGPEDGARVEHACGQDGSGVVDAAGPGVAHLAVGDRVWVYLATHLRPGSGTSCRHPTGRTTPTRTHSRSSRDRSTPSTSS